MSDSKYIRYIFISTSIIAFILIVIVLKTLKAIFIPLLFSLFISFMYAPLNRKLEEKNIPVLLRLIVLGIILLVLGLIIGTLAQIGLNRFVTESPKYLYRIQEMILNIAQSLPLSEASLLTLRRAPIDLMMLLNRISVNSLLTSVMNHFMTFFSYSLLTLFFTVFIVSDDNQLFRKIIRALCKNKEFTDSISIKIEKQLILYLLNKTLINLMSSVSSALLIFFVGVDFPILSGMLIFIFGFIPEIGSVIAALFPIIFCFFEFGMSWQLLVIIFSLLAINSGFGNYVEPRLMGRQFNLSPIIILCVLIFWAWVWGPVGMFIAVPLTSIINIILIELKHFSPLTDIISYPHPDKVKKV